MRTVVGIIGNEVIDSGRELSNLPIVYTPSGYVKGVQKAGGIPLIVPIDEREIAHFYIQKIDKLILAGGQNIHPKFYGAEMATDYDISYLPRDEFELSMVSEAMKQEKPIFAVCRGFHMLNVSLGGTLHQKIADKSAVLHLQAPISGETPIHSITTEKNSILRKIYGEKTKVNSFHRQGIDRLAEGLSATAWSEDGLIEGIENRKQRLLGVQWAYMSLKQEQDIFDYVVSEL